MPLNNRLTWSRTQVVEYINKNQIDFVARVSTSWHLLGVKAFLNNLYKQLKRDLNGLLIISAHEKSRYYIEATDVEFKNYIHSKVVYMDADGDSEKKQLLLKAIYNTKTKNDIKHSIYILSPNDGWYLLSANIDRRKYNTISVVIDEGFSQYNEKRQWILAAYQDKKSIKHVVKVIAQTILNEMLKKKSGENEIIYTLFDKKSNMRKNENVILSYQSVINDETRDLIINDSTRFLFLSQPFVEDGHISEKEMRLFYDEYFLIDNNRDTAFKIHPRDKTSYEIISGNRGKIIETNLNAEAYCAALRQKPHYVIGFNSTSLITLSLFFGIKSISLIHLLNDRLDGDCWKESFGNFEKYFSDVIAFPKNFIELRNILEVYE